MKRILRRSRGFHFASGLLALALLSGCGRKAADDHAHGAHEGHGHGEEKDDAHAESEGGVTFAEGRGLALSPEVLEALGVKTTAVEERAIAGELRLLAQVFATQPLVLASASLGADTALRLEKTGVFTGAKVVRIDRSTTAATGRAEAIFAIEGERQPARALGEFVEVTLAGAPRPAALTVPHSAILDAAAGTFVYVANGTHYLRTAVKLGVRAGDFVEIADGLYAGDIVVTAPVNQLWLTELRLTKGGGHSH